MQPVKGHGVTSGIGGKTYFGTDESFPIMPVLTCNPTEGLKVNYQILNGACFAAPALSGGGTSVTENGGEAYPYMHATPYFDNDLAIYRSFHIYEKQQVQIRASAFDWLNHPLPEFSNSTPYTINYNMDYAARHSRRITTRAPPARTHLV